MVKFTKEQLQFIKFYFEELDEIAFVTQALAFEPKKKVMKEVPDEERCVATKKDGERCTKRRGKECGDKCSIHFGKPETPTPAVADAPAKVRCAAITKKNEQCKKNAVDGHLCSIHLRAAPKQAEVVEVA